MGRYGELCGDIDETMRPLVRAWSGLGLGLGLGLGMG